MTTYHKILSADKTELRRIAIQTAELNQKMYAMLDDIDFDDVMIAEALGEDFKDELIKLLAEARGGSDE